MPIEYKDAFTLDGRVRPGAGVTRAKFNAVKTLVNETMNGSFKAKGVLQESLTTSDAMFNFAHLLTVSVLPQYDEAPRTWTQIATTRTVGDFRPAILHSLTPQWENGTLGDGVPNHVAPVVPEGTAYPYSTFTGEVSAKGGIEKRGFKFGLTWEAIVNDLTGLLQDAPSAMRNVALDTEEDVVYTALLNGVTSAEQLAAGTTVTGEAVPANAPLSREALSLAISQLKSRSINGRQVQINGGFNLLVAPGQGELANFIVNNIQISEVTDGSLTLAVSGYNPLGGVTVIETPYVTGTNWYVLPKPGTARRPVLELARLAGHEAPELRVADFTGSYVGGGSVSPFEGDFNFDTVDFRLRQAIGGLNWTPGLILWSLGNGS